MITGKGLVEEVAKVMSSERSLGIVQGIDIARECIINALLDRYEERLSDGSRIPNIYNDSLDETLVFIEETLEEAILERGNK